MSRSESARGGAAPPGGPLRLVAPAPLRIVDIALLCGPRGGATESYLERKAARARHLPTIDHHLVVPGRVPDHGKHAGRRHELASLRLPLPGGCRLILGLGPLEATLRILRPEVVLLHGSFPATRRIVRLAHELGAIVVAVHHERRRLMDRAPGASRRLHGATRVWLRRLEADVDVVMDAAPFDEEVAQLERLVAGSPVGARHRLAVAEPR